ncbi:hypothetical protein ACC718_37510, partial [Rhizobium ruizarguesonis]
LNFLALLRGNYQDYVLNDAAFTFLENRQVDPALLAHLKTCEPRQFANQVQHAPERSRHFAHDHPSASDMLIVSAWPPNQPRLHDLVYLRTLVHRCFELAPPALAQVTIVFHPHSW